MTPIRQRTTKQITVIAEQASSGMQKVFDELLQQ
jgi:hypothetical protein